MKRICKLFKSLVLLQFLLLPVFLCACDENESEAARIYLDEDLTFKIADESNRLPVNWQSGYGYHKLSLEDRLNLTGLINSNKGYVWLRTEFEIGEELVGKSLGFFLGRISFSDAVYLNGVEIAKEGGFPPEEFPAGGKFQAFYLPEHLLKKNAKNVILIRVFVEGKGLLVSKPFISEYQDVMKKSGLKTYFDANLNQVFSLIVFVVAVFFLLLYLFQKRKEYILFSMMTFFSAIYLLSYCISELQFMSYSSISYLTFCKILKNLSACCTAYFATSFTREYLNRKDSKPIIIIRLILLLLPVFDIIFFEHTYIGLNRREGLYLLFVFLQIIFILTAVVIESFRKNRRILFVMSGYVPVFICLLVDLILRKGLNHFDLPLFSIFGWQFVILNFLTILALRMNRLLNETVNLKQNLQQEVDKQTNELLKKNEELETIRVQSVHDKKIALLVQQKIAGMPGFDFNDWDYSVYFKPYNGVTGDFYDLYVDENELSGFSLFDVGQNGVSSGLISLLVKENLQSAIKKQCTSGMYNYPVENIVSEVNDFFEEYREEIQSSLSGNIFCFTQPQDKKPCSVKLVNIDGTRPVFFHAENKEIELLVNQYEFTGNDNQEKNAGEVCMQVKEFSMKKNDIILCYTKSFEEALNADEEKFGTERIKKALENTTDMTAEDILKKVLVSFYKFIDFTKMQKSITVFVLRRK